VPIRQFSKKLQSDPDLIRPKLASVLIQSDTILIRAHLIYVQSELKNVSAGVVYVYMPDKYSNLYTVN